MGIDIRDGQQLECITCALCIDACDTVMDKVGRPLGLISYSTLVDFEHHTQTTKAQGREAAKAEQKRVSLARMATPRTILYFGLWAAIGLGMLFVLFTRGHLDVTVLHDRAPLYTTLSDGSVRNGYALKVASKTLEERPLELRLEGLEDAVMWTPENETRARSLSVVVPPDAVRDLRVFVSRPRGATSDSFTFVLTDPQSGETVASTAQFEAGARR
jgi:polyferredoxin